jgi:FAD/FMN-containing dehydrogenase
MRKSTRDAELRELSRDGGILTLTPKVAYFAETEEEVVRAMREASVAGLSVTPRGGGTGIPTQSVGRGAILLQSRRHVEVRSDHAICHPGVVKAELNMALTAADRWMPVDPSSYASCTVGGMVANNSSGIRTPKYGSTIDYVMGLRVAFADGEAKPVSPIPAEEALHSDPRTRKAASLVLENISEIMDERPNVT